MSAKQIIRTEKSLPKGPYCSGEIGNLLFVAGQIPIDTAGNPVGVGNSEEQTRKVRNNMKAILGAASTSLDNGPKTTVYLQDLAEWGRMNAVYTEFFKKDPPARDAVQTDFSGLKNHWSVEIDAVAFVA